MLQLIRSRQNLAFAILASYFLPLLALTALYSVKNPDGFFLFSVGLTLSAAGSLFWLSFYPEPAKSSPLQEPDYTSSEEVKELKQQIEEKQQQIHSLRNDQKSAREDYEDIRKEFATFKETSQNGFKQKEVYLEEYQKTINEQREVIEKKQTQIQELDAKVRDLNYEIRTLIQVNESASSGYFDKPPQQQKLISPFFRGPKAVQPSLPIKQPSNKIQSSDHASYQLKRCLDIAQKITAASTFGSSFSRFGELSANHFALDMRRLCDSLQSENFCPVLFYSQKEKKLLFANNQAKEMLGWSPEKLTTNFKDIVQEGYDEWEKAILSASPNQEMQVRLIMRTRNGENLLIHALLGLIPTGLFRHNAIAVLYSA